jgi:hypothetical protein
MRRGFLVAVLLAPLCLVGCGSPVVTLLAQALPLTKTVLWDPNPATD